MEGFYSRSGNAEVDRRTNALSRITADISESELKLRAAVMIFNDNLDRITMKLDGGPTFLTVEAEEKQLSISQQAMRDISSSFAVVQSRYDDMDYAAETQRTAYTPFFGRCSIQLNRLLSKIDKAQKRMTTEVKNIEKVFSQLREDVALFVTSKQLLLDEHVRAEHEASLAGSSQTQTQSQQHAHAQLQPQPQPQPHL